MIHNSQVSSAWIALDIYNIYVASLCPVLTQILYNLDYNQVLNIYLLLCESEEVEREKVIETKEEKCDKGKKTVSLMIFFVWIISLFEKCVTNSQHL